MYRRRCLAFGTEMAAPPAVDKKRDTFAQDILFTCLFALVNVVNEARRLGPVFFTTAMVTFHKPEVHPRTLRRC